MTPTPFHSEAMMRQLVGALSEVWTELGLTRSRACPSSIREFAAVPEEEHLPRVAWRGPRNSDDTELGQLMDEVSLAERERHEQRVCEFHEQAMARGKKGIAAADDLQDSARWWTGEGSMGRSRGVLINRQ